MTISPDDRREWQRCRDLQARLCHFCRLSGSVGVSDSTNFRRMDEQTTSPISQWQINKTSKSDFVRDLLFNPGTFRGIGPRPHADSFGIIHISYQIVFVYDRWFTWKQTIRLIR